MFAAKIFDQDPEETTVGILETVKRDGLGVELALYGGRGFSKSCADSLLGMDESKKRLHLSHGAYCAEDIANKDSCSTDLFRHELHEAASMGIFGLIVHPFANSKQFKSKYAEPDGIPKRLDLVIRALAIENEMAKSRFGRKFSFMIENIYDSPGFFKDVLTLSQAAGVEREIGLCLDIGHAKVWGGGAPLSEWIGRMLDAREAKSPLHFHLHNNDGTRDAHLSFENADEAGLNGPGQYCGPEGYSGAVAEIIKSFPEAVHCLENSSLDFHSNWRWMLKTSFGEAKLP